LIIANYLKEPVAMPPPTSAAEVRQIIASSSPSALAISLFLSQRVTELKGLGLATRVGTAQDLIPVLATDLESKSSETKTRQQWLAMAKSQIETNNTTALTTMDDHFTGLIGGIEFDELHELIHICSSQGGVSPLHTFKFTMNEGAINYFSELAATSAGVTPVLRYPKETKMVERLVKLIGNSGRVKLYDATFKGMINEFFNAVGTAYVSLGNLEPSGKKKGFSTKNWIASEAAAEFKKAVGNWNTSWLDKRLPA
jgi:hypothetical protein